MFPMIKFRPDVRPEKIRWRSTCDPPRRACSYCEGPLTDSALRMVSSLMLCCVLCEECLPDMLEEERK